MKIVIIGGGFCGSECARLLEKNHDVTLIDTKDYFEFTPSVLRTIVQPDYLKKIQVRHNHYLKKTKIMVDTVEEISKKSVLLKNGKEIDYDYLIISSGSSYNMPFKQDNCIMEWRGDSLRDFNQKIQKAKSIIIIGGGIVGVEIAGELTDYYSDKKITLCQSNSELMPRNHKKTREYTKNELTKRGVKLIFNKKVESTNKNTFTLDDGTKIQADLSFLCVGIKPNYEFMKKNFSKSITPRNQIKTNEFLQLKGHKKIFVGGDVTDIQEEKLAQVATMHAHTIVNNIKAIEEGKELKEYKSKKRGIVISIGEKRGVLEYKNFVLTGYLPSIAKKLIERIEMKKFA